MSIWLAKVRPVVLRVPALAAALRASVARELATVVVIESPFWLAAAAEALALAALDAAVAALDAFAAMDAALAALPATLAAFDALTATVAALAAFAAALVALLICETIEAAWEAAAAEPIAAFDAFTAWPRTRHGSEARRPKLEATA